MILGLDEVDDVAERVAQERLDAIKAIGRRLRELDAERLESLVLVLHVVGVDHQERNRSRLSADDGLVVLGGWLHERELEAFLLGRLDREPAVLGSRHVGDLLESELRAIELGCLILQQMSRMVSTTLM